jgi:hypothetical protein
MPQTEVLISPRDVATQDWLPRHMLSIEAPLAKVRAEFRLTLFRAQDAVRAAAILSLNAILIPDGVPILDVTRMTAEDQKAIEQLIAIVQEQVRRAGAMQRSGIVLTGWQ